MVFKITPRLFAHALISVIIAPAWAEITLKGRVVDETNAPVAGAHVRFSPGSPDVVFSDATGGFEARLPALGRYLLNAAREGFFTLENHPVEIAAERELLIVLNHKRELFESVKVTARGDPAGDLERNYSA